MGLKDTVHRLLLGVRACSALKIKVKYRFMDFIERIFHLSPDQGSGSYEVWLVVLAGFLVLAAGFAIQRRRRHRRHNKYGDK